MAELVGFPRLKASTQGSPLGFFISADSNQVKVACFHTLLQVRILRELGERIRAFEVGYAAPPRLN